MRNLNSCLFCSLLFLFFQNQLYSQSSSDSVINLKEVTVNGIRLRDFNTGYFYSLPDLSVKTIQATSYLNDLLTNTSNLQVNANGTGMSSVSARGMGEERTPVIWNGFNIQDIVSSAIDIAELPVFFFEDVRIQMGGSSALFGSGAAGGILHLSNTLQFDEGLKAQINSYAGSFNSYYNGYNLSYSDVNYSGAIKMYANSSENDFPYRDLYEGNSGNVMISGRQTNAQAIQNGVMMNNFVKLNASQLLNFNVWYNYDKKNIAPTLDILSSNATQRTQFFAGSAEWKLQQNKWGLCARTGIFNNVVDYTNPSYSDTSRSNSIWSVTEFEGVLNLPRFFKINTGINQTIEQARSSTFTELEKRYRSAVFSSLKFLLPEFEITGNVRGEMVNGNIIPLTYSAGTQISPLQSIKIKANIAKNYRIPDFNELYYKDAYSHGNPALKPETGINYETGAEFSDKIAGASIVISANGFYSKMKDWINWLPDTNFIWNAKNIDNAIIKGIESSAQAEIFVNKWNIKLIGMFTWMDARNTDSSKFLAYVPENKTVINVFIKLSNTSLLFQHTFVGKRYANDKNTQTVDAYSLENITLSQRIVLKKLAIDLDFSVNNLWNKDYMVIQDYPMPRQNFRAGIRASF